MKKVGDWKVFYYFSGIKMWKYGCFIIYMSCICFVEDNEGRDGVDVWIFFEDFFELKKEMIFFFFGVIIVCVWVVKYWFLLFIDWGYVFNIIEYFWKENLFVRWEEIIFVC